MANTNNAGPKSYQHSRKNSNVGGNGFNGSNWDQASSSVHDNFDDMQDIDVKINYQKGVH